MPGPLVLASASPTRARMLQAAGLVFTTDTPRLDEDAIRAAMTADGAPPRDIADALAGAKAERIARRHPGAWVIGADQVLDLDGQVLGKPSDSAQARSQLLALRNRSHRLLSACVVHADGAPVWRHVGTARLTMRAFSDAWLDLYLARQGDAVTQTLGGYRIEEEGVRLFSRIEGDYFTILGLPLTELLSYLTQRGAIDS